MNVVVTFALATIAAAGSCVAGAELRVVLSPEEQIVVAGEIPVFSVRIEAVGTSSRVMRLNERDDLRVNYARLRITEHGKPVELPRFISDPGPVGPNDYVALKPGQSMHLVHRGEPFGLAELRPGSYAAKVTVHHELVGGSSIESNPVKITVRGK